MDNDTKFLHADNEDSNQMAADAQADLSLLRGGDVRSYVFSRCDTSLLQRAENCRQNKEASINVLIEGKLQCPYIFN